MSVSLFSAILIRNSLNFLQSLSKQIYSDLFQSKILCGLLCGTKAQTRKKPFQIQGLNSKFGGSGEIRTHGGRKPSSVFKTGAFNRSATLPCREEYKASSFYSRKICNIAIKCILFHQYSTIWLLIQHLRELRAWHQALKPVLPPQ